MSKKYKLELAEQKRIAQTGEVLVLVESLQNLLGYLKQLVEADRQDYVNKVVRPRLKLPEPRADKPDIRIDVVKGEIIKL